MAALEALGVGLALDHCGTDQCSLSLLRRLPSDQVKIAPAFAKNVLREPNDDTIAQAFMALMRGLGLEVLAEGVEASEQHAFLARRGCRAFQGYLFGRPGPAEALHRPRV